MAHHTPRIHQLLAVIDDEEAASQRHLARRLGIALGLTNLLLRRIISKGWVKVVQLQRRRVRYILTPAGVAARARLTRQYLQSTLHFYGDARERVRERFSALSAELGALGTGKRIVFFGAGEVAEIGFVSLQETDLELVGVVDAVRTKPFFGFPVRRPDELAPGTLNGSAFDRLVVMSFTPAGVERVLRARGVDHARVFWI